MPKIEPTHLYYNIDVCNINTENNGTYSLLAKPCDFIENRANSYIEHPEDYDLSVMSFNIDNNYLPLQVVQPLLGKTLTDKGYPTIYTISVGNNATGDSSGPINLFWKPADTRLKLDTTITKNDFTNEYFWNYSINYFLEILNNAIKEGLSAISPSGQTLFPFFYYDSSISRITISAPLAWSSGVFGDNNGFTLYINEALYSLLGGFSYLYETYNFPQGYYRLLMVDSFTNRYEQPDTFNSSTTTTYLKLIQSFNSIQNWNPVSSILFLSPILPVVNELMAKPLIYGSNENSASEGDVLNILLDFTVSYREDPDTAFRPTGQFILTSLFGKHPVSELQVITKWRDTFGNILPLKLEHGSSFEMKILLRKKDFRRQKI
jgi:hypothetical protein